MAKQQLGPAQPTGMSRRNFLRFASISAGALAIAACAPVQQGSGGSAAPGAASTTIGFLTQGGDEAAVNRYKPLIEQFQSDNSDITIEMILEPGGAIEVQTKLLTLIAAGEAPDTYWAQATPMPAKPSAIFNWRSMISWRPIAM